MKDINATVPMDRPGGSAFVPQRIEIDFLFLDLSTCTRCVGTDKNLRAALETVRQVLETTGVEVTVRKTLVESEDQALALRFVSSPTIRVNGRDIALEFRESRCEDCESCACGESVNCRVWVYQDKEYTEAPVGMIVEAILKAVYGMPSGGIAEPGPYRDIPENLKRFFSGHAKKEIINTQRAEASERGRLRPASPVEGATRAPLIDCCPPAEQAVCCEPSEKEACCGTSGGISCGCR